MVRLFYDHRRWKASPARWANAAAFLSTENVAVALFGDTFYAFSRSTPYDIMWLL